MFALSDFEQPVERNVYHFVVEQLFRKRVRADPKIPVRIAAARLSSATFHSSASAAITAALDLAEFVFTAGSVASVNAAGTSF